MGEDTLVDGPVIVIRYDGGDADGHVIDMRLLGESLVGLDRIISDGLIAIVNARPPKRGERAPLVLKAKEPVQGSFEIYGYLQEAAGLLALGMPLIISCGADLITDWTKAVFYQFTGKPDLSEKALEAVVETQQAHLASRDASDERQHEERLALLSALRETVGKLGPAAVDVAAPVGESVSRVGIGADSNEPLMIDGPTAEVLREKVEPEVGELQDMLLRVDGFTFHTRKLSVENPERKGYLLADVKDPVFDEESNPYTKAAQRKAVIRVKAKPGRRNGRLEKIYIMDFGGEVEDAA